MNIVDYTKIVELQAFMSSVEQVSAYTSIFTVAPDLAASGLYSGKLQTIIDTALSAAEAAVRNVIDAAYKEAQTTFDDIEVTFPPDPEP